MIQNNSNSKEIKENYLIALNFSHSWEFCALKTMKNAKFKIYKVKEIQNIDTWELLQEFSDFLYSFSCIDWAKDDKIICGSGGRVFIYRKVGNHHIWEKIEVYFDKIDSIEFNIVPHNIQFPLQPFQPQPFCEVIKQPYRFLINFAKWAPSGKKFAIGCLEYPKRCLAFGFYNSMSSSWTTKSSNKFSESFTSLSFHPSSNLVAVSTNENSIYVITCSFKSNKELFISKSDIEDNTYQGPFSSVNTLFEVLVKVECPVSWPNRISWELNGSFLLNVNPLKIFTVDAIEEKMILKEMDLKWNGEAIMSAYISEKGVLFAGDFYGKVAVFKRSKNTYHPNEDGFIFANYLKKNEHTEKAQKTEISQNGINGELCEMDPIFIFPFGDSKLIISYNMKGDIKFWK